MGARGGGWPLGMRSGTPCGCDMGRGEKAVAGQWDRVASQGGGKKPAQPSAAAGHMPAVREQSPDSALPTGNAHDLEWTNQEGLSRQERCLVHTFTITYTGHHTNTPTYVHICTNSHPPTHIHGHIQSCAPSYTIIQMCEQSPTSTQMYTFTTAHALTQVHTSHTCIHK